MIVIVCVDEINNILDLYRTRERDKERQGEKENRLIEQIIGLHLLDIVYNQVIAHVFFFLILIV